VLRLLERQIKKDEFSEAHTVKCHVIMFGHRNFLILGGDSPADIKSLTEAGYELDHCRFGFKQGIDANGKVTTSVYSGMIEVALSQLPLEPVIEWALNSRKYVDGVIVTLDADNIPVEKVFFKNAACTGFNIDYTLSDKSYITTKLEISAEQLIVGSDISFQNKWIYD